MDYTRLSLAQAGAALLDVGRDTQATFGALDVRQLNWQPDATRWSIAQCFDHLLTANRLMLRSAQDALEKGPTIWGRLPLLPHLCGPMLVRSQAPEAVRRFSAPRDAQPAASDIPADVLQRFVDQQREAAAWMGTLDEGDARRTIMSSPFLRLVTYSVLDGCRLIVAHDRRHIEQARRVLLSSTFPRASTVA